VSILLAGAFSLVACTYLWPTQRRLDRWLIAALRSHDAGRACALLRQGANPESQYTTEPTPEEKEYARQNRLAPDPPYTVYALHIAAGSRSDMTAAIRALIAAGAKVDARDSEGATPLMAAASAGSAPNVEALLSAGARVDLRDDRGQTALHRAASPDVVELLIGHRAAIDARDQGDATPLIPIAGRGNPLSLPTVGALIRAGAEVNATDRMGRTALMNAAAFGCMGNLKELLLHGADSGMRDKRGYAAYSYAVHSHVTAAALLLRNTPPLARGPGGMVGQRGRQAGGEAISSHVSKAGGIAGGE
jgi:ankyrin repeat protein